LVTRDSDRPITNRESPITNHQSPIAHLKVKGPPKPFWSAGLVMSVSYRDRYAIDQVARAML
jgi:hypothetical protein